MPRFTVCVLLFGDYPNLAQRCLDSLAKLPDDVDLRLATNAVSEATAAIVTQFVKSQQRSVLVINNEYNEYKYPVMRRLLYDQPIETEFVMWFDDDSYITARDVPGWLGMVEQSLRASVIIGSLYRMRLQGGQSKWIEKQPWYTQQPVSPLHVVTFTTGGWWVARTEVLKSLNYPWPSLIHNGGDVMLGEALRQQGYTLKHFNQGVAVNADEKGGESKAPRRGFSSKPIGFDYWD